MLKKKTLIRFRGRTTTPSAKKKMHLNTLNMLVLFDKNTVLDLKVIQFIHYLNSLQHEGNDKNLKLVTIKENDVNSHPVWLSEHFKSES